MKSGWESARPDVPAVTAGTRPPVILREGAIRSARRDVPTANIRQTSCLVAASTAHIPKVLHGLLWD
jgi:hypothetical protein